MCVWERRSGSASFPRGTGKWEEGVRGAACCRLLSSRAWKRWGEGLELPRALALGQLWVLGEASGLTRSWLLLKGRVAIWLSRAKAGSLPPDVKRAVRSQLRCVCNSRGDCFHFLTICQNTFLIKDGLFYSFSTQ